MSVLIEFFNKYVAVPAGAPLLADRKVIPVEGDDESYPITVWQKRRVNVSDEFYGENEDGYRWVTVYNGIRPTANAKPF